jgi:hypothetical protein
LVRDTPNPARIRTQLLDDQLAGYWILRVASMEEAIEWAKRFPFEAGGEPEAEGKIELRRLFELEEFGKSPPVEQRRQLEGSCPKEA